MSIDSIATVKAVLEPQMNETVGKTPLVKRPDRNVASAVVAANEGKLFGQSNELALAVDRQTRAVIVRLVEKATGNVVRQVPIEELLRLTSMSVANGFETV